MVATLLAGACSGTKPLGSASGSGGTTPPAPQNVHLAGLKGTAPITDVPSFLRTELQHLAPAVGDATIEQAVRPYDAVVLTALAAEEARTDQPARIADHMIDASSSGTRCATYSDCKQLTDQGLDLHYIGASGALDLAADGQTTDTSYGEYEFNNAGALTKLSNQSTQLTDAVPPAYLPDPTQGPRADGVVRIGMIYPSTGPLAPVGEAAEAGIRAGVADVNANGGAVGRPVQLVDGDSQDGSAGSTAAAVTALLAKGVDVIIGGAGQTDTAAMLDPVTRAGVVLISPNSFTSADPAVRGGLFFRLSPPDTAQGSVLADVVGDDGITHVTVLAEHDDLDGGMAISFRAAFDARDGIITQLVTFEPTDSPASVIAQATSQPTAGYVFLADLSTTSRLLDQLQQRGLGPQKIATYVANVSPLLATATS